MIETNQRDFVRPALALLIALGASRVTPALEAVPLALESTIQLGQIGGRLDHLAVDLQRRRLFVAELGNDSVGVVDLKSQGLSQTLKGLSEPQGILFVAATDELYVANGGDGSVHIFRGTDLAPAGTVPLGDDADNLRFDDGRHSVVAGYGSGGLALIDTASHRVVADIPLRGHPEGFQLSNDGRRAFVNMPQKREIAVVDLPSRQRIATWPTGSLNSNFPMALQSAGDGIWVGFRSPPRLVRFDTNSGAANISLQICDDTDDVFIDQRRSRLYVICGSGILQVWERRGVSYERIASIPTAPGARTGLFVPELDRLYIATPARPGHLANILVFRPGLD